MSKYTYNQITPEIIEQLKIAANGHVIVDGDINEDFSHDEMRIYGENMPDVLVEPTTTEEVAAVMKIGAFGGARRVEGRRDQSR